MDGHILLKFTDYVDDFLKGSLYMNTLHYFWYEYRDKAIKKYLEDHPGETRVPITALKDHVPQEDMFEGSIGIGSGPDEELNEYSLTDTIYRAVGYQYCNVLCLYRLDYEMKMIPGIGMTVHYNVPNMEQFGNNAVIIDDEGKFISRIGRAAEKQGYSYLCGNVSYWTPRNAEVMSDKPHLLLESEQGVDISEEPFASMIKVHKDCFQKINSHRNEREWRVALYRGVKDTEAYRLEVGDLRDICHVVKEEELVEKIDMLFKTGKIKTGGTYSAGYYGNTDRRAMLQKFYDLGNNKAQMLVTIG